MVGARPFLLPGEQPRSLRSLLLLTAASAFFVGIVIGVTIPLYVLPPPAALASPQQRRALPPSLPAPVDLPPSSKISESSTSSANSINGAEWAYSEGKGWRRRTVSPTGNATPHPAPVSFVEDAKVAAESSAEAAVPSRDPPTFHGVSFVTPSMDVDGASVKNSPGDAVGAAPQEEWPDVISGAFWGETVESAIPRGFADSDSDSWRKMVRSAAVVGLEEGCGRMQNRLLTLEGGVRACARYRQNTDQIQGEIFGFYLAGLLGMGGHVAPSSLAVVGRGPTTAAPNSLDSSAEVVDRWAAVRGALGVAQWADGKAVVLTQFVDGLGPAFIPPLLRGGEKRMHPPDVKTLIRDGIRTSSLTDLVHQNTTGGPSSTTTVPLPSDLLRQLTELAQWSDLLVFDYLTANLDRVVNNLYNLQWNPAMLDSPAHNLARLQVPSPSVRPFSPGGSPLGEGHLLFLDNESALLHGYRLLPKYERYHASLLDSACVFRRSTVDAVRRLRAKRPEVGEALRRSFQNFDPEFRDVLPFLPEKSLKILNMRIERVHEHMVDCQRRYESRARQGLRKDSS